MISKRQSAIIFCIIGACIIGFDLVYTAFFWEEEVTALNTFVILSALLWGVPAAVLTLTLEWTDDGKHE